MASSLTILQSGNSPRNPGDIESGQPAQIPLVGLLTGEEFRVGLPGAVYF